MKPILRGENGELVGFVSRIAGSWAAMTIFGYTITRVETEEEASDIVRTDGLTFLQGLWQYYDESDKQWYPCTLKEVYENKVVLTRTNDMGYEDPNGYKRVTLRHPSEANLQKS